MFFKKRVSLKPIVLLEVIVIVLLASVGVAVALNATGSLKGGDYDVDLSQGTITDTQWVSATDYSLVLDGTATHVHAVDVVLTNTDTSAHTINLTVKLGNNAWTTSEIKVVSSVSVVAGGQTQTVTLDSDFATTDLYRIHIYVEETA